MARKSKGRHSNEDEENERNKEDQNQKDAQKESDQELTNSADSSYGARMNDLIRRVERKDQEAEAQFVKLLNPIIRKYLNNILKSKKKYVKDDLIFCPDLRITISYEILKTIIRNPGRYRAKGLNRFVETVTKAHMNTVIQRNWPKDSLETQSLDLDSPQVPPSPTSESQPAVDSEDALRAALQKLNQKERQLVFHRFHGTPISQVAVLMEYELVESAQKATLRALQKLKEHLKNT